MPRDNIRVLPMADMRVVEEARDVIWLLNGHINRGIKLTPQDIRRVNATLAALNATLGKRGILIDKEA